MQSCHPDSNFPHATGESALCLCHESGDLSGLVSACDGLQVGSWRSSVGFQMDFSSGGMTETSPVSRCCGA